MTFHVCILVLTIGTGHPIRNHGKKSHHFLTRKTKINKHVQRTPNQNKEKKSSFLNAQLNARAGSTEDAKKKGTIRILGTRIEDVYLTIANERYIVTYLELLEA